MLNVSRPDHFVSGKFDCRLKEDDLKGPAEHSIKDTSIIKNKRLEVVSFTSQWRSNFSLIHSTYIDMQYICIAFVKRGVHFSIAISASIVTSVSRLLGKKHGVDDAIRVEFEWRGLWTLGWHHRSSVEAFNVVFQLFFYIWRRSHQLLQLCCIGCNAVYPRNSKSVLWTQTLHPPPPPSISIGGTRWWVNLTFWVTSHFNCHNTVCYLLCSACFIVSAPQMC